MATVETEARTISLLDEYRDTFTWNVIEKGCSQVFEMKIHFCFFFYSFQTLLLAHIQHDIKIPNIYFSHVTNRLILPSAKLLANASTGGSWINWITTKLYFRNKHIFMCNIGDRASDFSWRKDQQQTNDSTLTHCVVILAIMCSQYLVDAIQAFRLRLNLTLWSHFENCWDRIRYVVVDVRT